MRKDSSSAVLARILVYLLLGVISFFLFYKQATGEYVADTVSHLNQSLNPQVSAYSLMTMLFRVSYFIAGVYGVAAMLAVVEVATIGVTEVLLRQLIPEKRKGGNTITCSRV